jgi:hypothetical protein
MTISKCKCETKSMKIASWEEHCEKLVTRNIKERKELYG